MRIWKLAHGSSSGWQRMQAPMGMQLRTAMVCRILDAPLFGAAPPDKHAPLQVAYDDKAKVAYVIGGNSLAVRQPPQQLIGFHHVGLAQRLKMCQQRAPRRLQLHGSATASTSH